MHSHPDQSSADCSYGAAFTSVKSGICCLCKVMPMTVHLMASHQGAIASANLSGDALLSGAGRRVAVGHMEESEIVQISRAINGIVGAVSGAPGLTP